MKNNIKISPLQEVEYQTYLKHEKVSLARFMCILSSLLYIAFIVVDIWALSSAFSTALIIRSGVVVALGITYLMTYMAFFDKYYSYIVSAMYLIAVFGIEAMIYIASPIDQAYETYFVGVILILITLFTWTYLKLRIALPLAILSILGYVYVEAIHRDLSIDARYSALLANIFFLGSAALLGFIGQLMRNKYLFQNFLLQKTLHESLQKKTIEANDYEHQANHDALTLLPNRRYITALLEESLQIAKEKDKILAILFFDLNGFKQINDIYGHAVGDEVLVIVAKRLELAIRKGDYISRLGGDEYLVGLMMDKEHVSEVTSMAEKFTAIISEPMRIDGNIVKVGTSVGIAAYPMHGNNIDVLIDIADKKMYNIKQGIDKVAKKPEEDDNSKAIVIFPSNSKKLQY